MSKISALNYIYAIGKIRALENFLIKQEVFTQALESTLAEALRLFVESDLYSDELLHIKDSQHLEDLLNQELLKLEKLLSELILDKELLKLLKQDNLKHYAEILKKFPSPFLEDYFLHFVDMHNIKTFLRLYLLKEPEEKLKISLTYTGFLPRQDFLKLYNQDLAIFLNRLEYVHRRQQIIDYAYYLKEAIQKIATENSFVALEKAIHDFLIQILKPAKYICFGPEPLLAYYFAKQNEINLIRMIILAKLNNVPVDLVKERLNAVYA